MKRKAPRRLRLSPNEEATLIREEHDRRRKLRLQQVREQSRAAALHIRCDVQRRRERELQLLAEELRQDWELQQREKIQALQKLYEESLRLLGQGHRSAKENEPNWEAMAKQAEENQLRAKQRYREALRELSSQRHKEQDEHNRPSNARRKALEAERERASRVASLPPPPPHPIETIEAKRPHAGKSDISVFSATRHHCPEPTVDREVPATQPDAHEEAQQEARRLQEWRSEAERQREEQQEKARLRGRCALKREQLTQDRERLVVELEHMQQTELLRRRQQVAQMPAQIFQPLHRRREAREDAQRDMEFAFEDMYTGERRVKGDLVLQLVPEPLPAPSTSSGQDQELDVTLDGDEDTAMEVNRRHTEPAAEEAEPPMPAHRQALRKLLDRIRTQRDQVSEPIRTLRDQGRDQVSDPIRTERDKGKDQVMDPIRTQGDQGRDHPQEPHLISSSAAGQPRVHPVGSPERDSSIDTGSLSVEDSGREAPGPHLHPEPPSALETTGEESLVAPLAPELLSSRMEMWKKREDVLEKEKQQQIILLEELEEQKSQLEGMLRDAQRQREDLQAAVNQEVLLRDQEVHRTAVSERSTVHGHSSRIRQHQQHLLEQSRIHQRSVEVARQRLEQYQQALRIRHGTAATPRPPAEPPAAPHPSLVTKAKTDVPAATPPALLRPTDRAAPPSALRQIPAGESEVRTVPPPPRLPGPGSRPETSLTPTRNGFPRDSPGDHADTPPPAQRAGLSAWLTDSIMERATGHLPESLRSPSAAPNPFIHSPPGATEHIATGGRQIFRSYSRASHLGADPARPPGPPAPQKGPEPQSFLQGQPLTQCPPAPRQGDVERQRRELLEAHTRLREQKEEVGQQLQRQEEVQRRREEERRSREEQQRWEEERWRREEQQRKEEQRRREESRRQEEQGRLDEQGRLEEERWRREEQKRREQQSHDEEQREQMRRQKEALQALINRESNVSQIPPVAEPLPTGEESGRSRQRLLSSLLRAIEESHGGSLSHLEGDPQPASCNPPPHTSDTTSLRVGVCEPRRTWLAAPPPRAQKPPLTRVKLGDMATLPRQHELSAIQEAETPGERSLVGPEDVMTPARPPGSWDRIRRPGTLPSHVEEPPSVCSPLPTPERSIELSLRDRMLEHPPETVPGPPRLSWRSSDQGGGSSVSPGSFNSGYTANSESAGRRAYSDSSTSLSTGSYVTTDPEHNAASSDVSATQSGSGPRQPVAPTTSLPSAASSPALSSSGSCGAEPSSAGHSTGPQTPPGPRTSPGLAVAALFHESSIQRIIDKYTRELNASLCTPADTSGSSIALEEYQVPQSPAQDQATTPNTETAPQRPGLLRTQEWDKAVNKILEQFSESISLVQDISFRPLIGQPADQSSCLAAEGQDSAVARVIGQPSAQSSMIGQLPGQSLHAGASRGTWDSTLSRMIDRLSHQAGSPWSSGERDSSQLMGRLGLASYTSFDERQDESGMRPLIGQLDESGIQRPASSGGLGSGAVPTPSEPVHVLEDPPALESTHPQPPAVHPPPPHQPSPHWPSGQQNLYPNQLIGQLELEQSSLWSNDGQEEGGMKPLIGQLYESTMPAVGSSGESSSSLGSVESVLVAPPVPQDPVQVPESPYHQPPAPPTPHQPSSHQPSGGQELYGNQLIRRLEFEQSSPWLNDGQEVGGMKPLIGQLYESGGQAAGSSGYDSYRTDQTRLNLEHDGTGGPVGSSRAAGHPVPEPEVLDTRSRPPMQDHSELLLQDPECSEVFAAQDSFHPLVAQVTHNETLEPSMTFHLPQQEAPSTHEGSHQSTGHEEAVSTDLTLSSHLGDDVGDSLVDPSPECPRAQKEEEVPVNSSSCLDSFCQLASSEPQSLLLLESPEEEEEEEELMVKEDGETDGSHRLVPTRGETTNQPWLTRESDTPAWDQISGAALEKGILEQSEITLLSVSDDCTLDPDATVKEDEEQEFDSTLLPGEDPAATQESPEAHLDVVPEAQGDPAVGLQEAFQRKRQALIQRSALRQEEIRAKRALADTRPSRPPGRAPRPSQTQTHAKAKLLHSQTGPHPGQDKPEGRTTSKGPAPGQLVTPKTKEPKVKSKGGGVPVPTAPVPTSSSGRKSKRLSPESDAEMAKVAEMKTCTPSQRKQESLEMHQRTQRLYGRLEEVKQQREVISRQESYAQNRLKAKEFHQKTLQKLRAKQTAQ